MDKISSIIPKNSRVTTVDLKASGVGRSGTPGFGRDTNVTNDRLHGHAADTATAAIERHNDFMAVRQPKSESQKAEIVTKMTEKFFTQKAKENELPEIKSEDKYNIEDMQPGNAIMASKPALGPSKGGVHQEVEMAAAEAEEEIPAVGGHLDIHA